MLDHAYVPHEFIFRRREFIEILRAASLKVSAVVNPSEAYLHEGGLPGLLARNERWFFRINSMTKASQHCREATEIICYIY